jgi:succinate dehydrogenase / fumarate reductase, cytochrome b subunit
MGFLTSSIGKKVIMMVTGLFLIVFLLVHLTLNLLTLVGDGSVFNIAAGFMGSNPVMKVMEIVLAAGFVFHMIYASYLTLKNRAARPVRYEVVDSAKASSWSSKNMYITGSVILAFLVLHLINYFYKIKFTDLLEKGEMTEYQLVVGLFQPERWYYVVIYIVSFILLALHLNHSFQSAFQTLGINNKIWLPRLRVLGTLYTLVIAAGFTIIPLYFLISALIK